MRKILKIYLSMLTILLITGCSEGRVRETDFFIWENYNGHAVITGLTEKGRKQGFLKYLAY